MAELPPGYAPPQTGHPPVQPAGYPPQGYPPPAPVAQQQSSVVVVQQVSLRNSA